MTGSWVYQPGVEERRQKQKLFQGDMKTEERAEIRSGNPPGIILQHGAVEVDKGIKIMIQRYADCV